MKKLVVIVAVFAIIMAAGSAGALDKHVVDENGETWVITEPIVWEDAEYVFGVEEPRGDAGGSDADSGGDPDGDAGGSEGDSGSEE